ncbi:MAG: 3-phosphoshikimate 1-carboxyvinyltransferase [Marinilabiliaceae bacterium]
MSTYFIKAPQQLSGEVNLPTSKSISNRLLILSALSGSRMLPDNLSDSDDTRVMIEAMNSDMRHVDVGAAGTSMRFLTAFLATRDGEHVITGSERMKKRPIALLVDALRILGAEIEYEGELGFPPLRIRGGKVSGGHITLPGGVSSQYISALMMIGPTLRGGLRLTLEGDIVSLPYILMTKRLMELFGAEVARTGGVIAIKEKPYEYRQMRVEADWSAASYWYSMAALRPGTTLRLLGLERESTQGDSEVARIAEPLGVRTDYAKDGVTITSVADHVDEYSYCFVNQPDLAQTFVVLCCLMGVKFNFTGLQSLRIKETDRISALVAETRKLGYVIEAVGDDCLKWDGTRCAPSHSPIATYKDHRMAMAFAPAALTTEGAAISEPSVVSKSYPGFWDDLRKSGFTIDEI